MLVEPLEPIPNGRVDGKLEELEPLVGSMFEEARFLNENFDTHHIVKAISQHLVVDENIVASVIETYVDMLAASIINGYGASIPRLAIFSPTWVHRKYKDATFYVPSIKATVDDKVIATMNAKNFSPFFDGQEIGFDEWKNVIPIVSRMNEQLTVESVSNNIIYANKKADSIVEEFFGKPHLVGDWKTVKEYQNEHKRFGRKKWEYKRLYESLGFPVSKQKREEAIAGE